MNVKMLGILIIIGVVVGLVVLVSALQKDKSNEGDSKVKELQTKASVFKDISASEAQSLIQENRRSADFVIIDVRTPSEYSGSRIENAINVNHSDSNFRDEISKQDRNKVSLAYCRM